MAAKEPRKKQAARRDAAKSAPATAAVFKELLVSELLEPLNPSRQTFDEVKLKELIESIIELGVIEPLIVEPEGAFYRVHAGHRRLMAVRAMKLEHVPCRIYPPGQASGEALKHHENKMREDVNAAEMGAYFWRLLEDECGGDVDTLCARLHETRAYVEQRLNLHRGDARVLEALRAGQINFGVALELNFVHDDSRRLMYLSAAIEGGASVRMVRDWRHRGNAQDELVPRPAITEAVITTEPPARPVAPGPECYICHASDDQHEMAILYVHRSCARAVERFQTTASTVNVTGGA